MCSIFVKLKLIALILLLSYSLINVTNAKSFQSTTSNKYHQLQVKILIFPDPENPDITNLHNIINDNLLICKAASEKKLTKERIDNLYALTNNQLLDILQTLGYYHANISSSDLIMQTTNSWSIIYQIKLGKPTIITATKLNLAGNIPDKFKSDLNHLFYNKLKINSKLNHQQYENIKQLILSKLKEQGFLAAEIKDAKILVNLSTYSAQINLDIDPKQRYYLGKINFKSDIYPSDFLHKYLPFVEKELYSSAKLMQLKNNLLNSGLFKKVRIDVADYQTLNDNFVPITTRVYAKPANSYLASVGFGSDSGFRGKLGFIHHFYQIPGHSLDLSLAFTKPRKKAILDYEFLGKDVLTTKYHCGLMVKQDKVKNRFSKSLESYWNKTYSTANYQRGLQLSFLHENYQEFPQTSSYHTHLLLPRIQFNWFNHTYSNNQDNLDPELASDSSKQPVILGTKLALTLKGSWKKILSTISMLQTTVAATYAKQIMEDYRIILKGKLGYTVAPQLQQLPLSLRFFAGGDHSIRGFGYNSLGPTARAPNGEYGVIGGKHLLLANLQLERRIPSYPNIAIAGFVDCGNAINNFSKLFKNQLAIGAGGGLLYYTPIGSINFYLAKPIKLPLSLYRYNKHIRIHLTFVADL